MTAEQIDLALSLAGKVRREGKSPEILVRVARSLLCEAAQQLGRLRLIDKALRIEEELLGEKE